jgi:trehalose synthase
MHVVSLEPRSTDAVAPLLEARHLARFDAALDELGERLSGRGIWHVNSTERGGGVAELLSTLLPYAIGAGVAARWAVLDLDEGFFEVTKRLHNALHGVGVDGEQLGPDDRSAYDDGLRAETDELLGHLTPGDVVVLHDPQTAGLVPVLRDHGLQVMWRCHIGADVLDDRARAAQRFLFPDVSAADLCLFSRPAHVWEGLAPERTAIVQPCIDIMSAKNRPLDDSEVGRILEQAGLPTEGRLVVQVSRWDRLKDPVGVIRAFAEHGPSDSDVHLCLAGPATDGVTDDPEGAEVLAAARAAWEDLPASTHGRVHLAEIPMDDLEENARIVNALQRRADVVVQKSLAEGFGLTVAEAMWKERPVVASRVGGIQDQIDDGVSGLLLDDPSDLRACGEAIGRVLDDPSWAAELGQAAHERVCEHFLPADHIAGEVAALDRLQVVV